MNERQLTDMERNNKTAMWCHVVEAILLTLIFAVQCLMGKRTAGYALLIAVLAFAPVIAEIFFWSKDHETPMIKHLVGIGFAVFYTFLIFTATNSLVFVYVIPMIMVIAIFNDASYSLKINIGTVIESLIAVIGGAATGKFGYRDLDSGVLQISVMVLIGVYSYFTARTLDQNNRQKIQNVMKAQEQTEGLLRGISDTSKKMQTGIGDIHERTEKLSASYQMTKAAMVEVTEGAGETADAVQRQLTQTEAIQQKIRTVGEVTGKINESMQQTLTVLESGNQDVKVLVQEVEASVHKGADAADRLERLDEYITEMNSIVELIGGITSQTSLLALNASIEAARAGEAGRGFSVVATEISAMATQTKDATAHITKLIANISGAINQVVSVVREMIDGINDEKQSTENTAASFEQIESNTFAIRDNVTHLSDNVTELEHANKQIAETVQTISAISEEVSAHANETLEAEEENRKNIDKIAEHAGELIALTQKE